MFTLADYRKLPEAIKSMATIYWVAFIMAHYEISSCYQLWKKIIPEDDWGGDNWVAKKSRFFNLKKGGNPIEKSPWIIEMERLVPRSQQCLTHPLWQLLGTSKPTQSRLNTILRELAPEVTNRLFVVNPTTGITQRTKMITSKQIDIIARRISLDSLTCLLILYLEDKKNNDSENYFIEKLILETLLCLLIHTPLFEVRDRLYNKIYELFFEERTPLADSTVRNNIRYLTPYDTHHTIPVPRLYAHSKNFNLTVLLVFYFEIIENMAHLKLFKDDPKNRLIITKLVFHSDLGWLISNIKCTQRKLLIHQSPSEIELLLNKFRKTAHLYL